MRALEVHLRLIATLPVRTHMRRETSPTPTGAAARLPDWKVERMRELEQEGMSRREISRILQVSGVTVRKRLGRKKFSTAPKGARRR